MAIFRGEIGFGKIAEFFPSITQILVLGTALHLASRKLPALIDTIRDVLHTLITLNAKYQALLKRANSPPGIPVANPSSPYWLDDPPFPDLVDRQDDIPDQADVVIIGSGIAGVSAAKAILELWPGNSSSSSSSSRSTDATSEEEGSNEDDYIDGGSPRPPLVVVLEARQICSGATGRNGGHIKSAPYEVYSDMRNKLGHERASAIVRFQMQHLPCLVELGKQFPLAEAREVETVDLFLEEKDLDEAEQHVKDAMAAVPKYTAEVWRGDEASKEFDTNKYIAGAISFKAGAIWPYRLVTSVWNHLLTTYPNLLISTRTPVHDIEASASTTHPYLVKSSRGTINARHVLHATNGFAPQFVPALRGRLTGALAHMSAQRPGPSFPAYHGDRSWSIIYAPGFDYITQRPDRADGTSGDLMVGGGFFRSKDEGMDQVGVWDDSRVDSLPMMHVRACMPGVFDPKWGIGGAALK
ncbi:FAD dependent oxidoreductase-domain-containing protein [Thamnocephalis sphaerospora]|uniref:FAD dependent oxidoreductase-domain-containing protein n=1 Tax=Thamnocephalis sphaerospora TaxID=78915 RepID=A0A4P9XG94_9FUNG|nr:FAD dependent oxidoreductase-domain-containing protein [Thamnocephalis sphaerospora]|eukprot:RKP04627.1 FAD dependent oxidoreductase-domain-containing protein [Thamnocephalis sphaerospora]